MAIFSFSLLDIIIGAIIIVYIIYAISSLTKTNKKLIKKPPEPPGSWPILGHLPLLTSAGAALPHETLSALADSHGPIFALRLGSRPVLVISDHRAAADCFATAANDKAFSSRPRTTAALYMGYDHAIFGLTPYGEYWSRSRKLVVANLLSPRRLKDLAGLRIAEIDRFIRDLHRAACSGTTVEIGKRFGDLTMEAAVKMLAGDRCGDDSRRSRRGAFNRFMAAIGIFMARDYVAGVGWVMDWAVRGRRCVAEMKETAVEIDGVLSQWVTEHRRVKKSESGEEDFVDVMLSALETDDGTLTSKVDADTVVKSSCLSLILGSYDTTSITLTWTLSLLLNNRHVLKRIQAELDVHVGKHRQVDELDLKSLIYLQAAVKETLRLYTPLPLSASREAIEDCHVAGYPVRAGTTLIVNLWKIHRDPSVWRDPLEFRPERFLEENKGSGFRAGAGTGFEYMPFGSGRRMCPGIGFAISVVHLTLARLVHGFEVETVDGEPVDLTMSPGLACAKATPLEVKLTPRLPVEVYG